jgi:hypothetical protein
VIFPKDARRGGDDRYSIAYFSHPGNEVELTAVPSKIVAAHSLREGEDVGHGGGAARDRPLTAHEHLLSRLKATYEFKGAKAKGEASVTR